jgi:hypothetical protein
MAWKVASQWEKQSHEKFPLSHCLEGCWLHELLFEMLWKELWETTGKQEALFLSWRKPRSYLSLRWSVVIAVPASE